MQCLAGAPWAVRNAVPLTPPGNIRMLDAVETRLGAGRGSRRARRRTCAAPASATSSCATTSSPRPTSPDPVLVHQALDGSPGLERVATFGPDVGGEAYLERRARAGPGQRRLAGRVPAVEVYAVGDVRRAGDGAADAPVVVGGPEDLLDLVDLGVLGRRADRAGRRRRPRRRPRRATGGADRRAARVERHFGRIHDGDVGDARDRATTRRIEQPDPRLPAPRAATAGRPSRATTGATGVRRARRRGRRRRRSAAPAGRAAVRRRRRRQPHRVGAAPGSATARTGGRSTSRSRAPGDSTRSPCARARRAARSQVSHGRLGRASACVSRPARLETVAARPAEPTRGCGSRTVRADRPPAGAGRGRDPRASTCAAPWSCPSCPADCGRAGRDRAARAGRTPAPAASRSTGDVRCVPGSRRRRRGAAAGSTRRIRAARGDDVRRPS